MPGVQGSRPLLARIWRVLPWALLAVAGGLAAVLWLAPGLLGVNRTSTETATGLPAPGDATSGALSAPGAPPALSASPADSPDPITPDLAARVDRLEGLLGALPSGSGGDLPSLPAGDVPARVAALEAEVRRLVDAQGAADSRFAALVAELDAAGLRSGGIAAATAQARDLFLLAAARRHLERGRPLGPVEAALRQQFGAREPSAVEAIAAWSRAPNARDLLAERLAQGFGAPAVGPAEDGGFWDRLRAQISGLVRLRRADGPDPAIRERAAARLAAGDLDGAITLLSEAPADPRLAAWLEDARRLSSAEAGLERLELLALQPPAPIPAAAP